MNARLVLSDGTQYEGESIGAPIAVGGEAVFNTAMSGYVETLTDPSYAGQILVLTYPLVGNYGVPPPRPARSIERPFESDRIQVQGLIVQTCIDDYSHRAATRSLRQWLVKEGIPAIAGIDTRALTRRLREQGTMQAWIIPATMTVQEGQERASAVEMRKEVFERVAPPEPITLGDGDVTVLVVDVGAKDNIVRSLIERRVRVIRAPWHARLLELANQADGILIGNGPGDPRDLGQLVGQVRAMLADASRPVLGVCLGNQLLALAAGGETYKLPYGHRSVNQPVQDLLTGKCYITSQNHGFAVNADTLPPDWEAWFVNTNDGTNEGIRSRSMPFFSVQFHPEAHPGPADAAHLFDDFLRLTGAMRKQR